MNRIISFLIALSFVVAPANAEVKCSIVTPAEQFASKVGVELTPIAELALAARAWASATTCPSLAGDPTPVSCNTTLVCGNEPLYQDPLNCPGQCAYSKCMEARLVDHNYATQYKQCKQTFDTCTQGCYVPGTNCQQLSLPCVQTCLDQLADCVAPIATEHRDECADLLQELRDCEDACP